MFEQRRLEFEIEERARDREDRKRDRDEDRKSREAYNAFASFYEGQRHWELR